MILKGKPEPEFLRLTWEKLPGAQQTSAVDDLSLINCVLFTMCIGAVLAGLKTLEERKKLEQRQSLLWCSKTKTRKCLPRD